MTGTVTSAERRRDKRMKDLHDRCIVQNGHHFHDVLDYKCLRCGLLPEQAFVKNDEYYLRPCRVDRDNGF